ncbi:apoptotic chromatin condensation inducer in the nucleus [Diachasma alloeum]|uniref:apoptotic chromatin condensation inducer in the nucleus n=1 Tax=Diachasma alloeum TaxID=454923 RepID=UPI00073843FC|nr:apoptotic chromatin condensation inducer in the nucleus [Diachasma alloeum]
MRRKSERNKGKSSPEKKPEKPTRKSNRRRAKKSPSTSPERSNSPEGDGLAAEKEPNVNFKIQSRLSSKETPETLVEEPESKVSSTDQQITGDLDDGGCVWKVARADASPGEIQKLKLCRQRNLSETSDASLSRKRVNKWHEGEGIAEEADSADERPATSNDKTDSGNIALADDTSSTTDKDKERQRESGEEVSDSKEMPPETTVDLSDVKPNIDQGHAESPEPEQLETKATQRNEDDPDNCQVHGDDANVSENIEIAQQEEEQQAKQQVEDYSRTSEKQDETEEDVTDVDVEKSIKYIKKDEKESQDDDVDTIRQLTDSVHQFAKDPSDDEGKSMIEETKRRNSSENSNDESVRPSRTRSVRRKHRDKYRDSSNSDTGETEEDEEEEDQVEKEEEEDDEDVEEEEQEKEQEEEEEKKKKKKSGKKSLDADNNKVKGNREKSPSKGVMEVEESKKDDICEEEDKLEVIISSTVENDKTPVREVKQPNVCRPAKVNLKRSFTSRISTEELKKDDAGSANDASQDKENYVADESKSIPKRRRWGTAFSTDIAPVLSISTDSLKALVPGAKPLSINEVRLSKDDDEDRNRRKDKRQMANDEDKSKADSEIKNDTLKDNHIGARRKISIVKDTPQLLSPSPPVAQPTSILLIKNLVRPFTLNQIKELLSRTGTIVENGFWIDRIKSKCFVEYANEDQAFETRQALHGISWPTSNPKKIQVEYSVKEEMEKAKECSKDQPLSRKLEASSGADPWQQDWGRNEKSNATTKVTVVREWDLGKEDGQHLLLKDKEKETKDRDKKRRQRSRSPTLEAHLPAPARKFKKKEDEPPPAKLLDDLFRKTKATPCIYWLPLTNEQIVVKEEMRRQHMAEHARRLEEMRRAERNRDGRRRRSPRK